MRCRDCGKRKFGRTQPDQALRRSVRLQAGTEKRRSNRTEKHEGRGRDRGMVTAIEHHDKATAEVTDIPDIFRSINYPGLVISLRQPLCQHSRSIILNARTQLDEPQTQLCLPKQIFSCASSLMRTYHETSLTVTGFPASPHRIPWSGSLQPKDCAGLSAEGGLPAVLGL